MLITPGNINMINDKVTAKDMVKYWMKAHQKYTNITYNPSWAKDCLRFAELMGQYRIRQIKKLISFAFESNHKKVEYFQKNGYPLEIFVRSISEIATVALSKVAERKVYFNNYELDLHTPYYNDERLVYMCKLIDREDIIGLRETVDNEEQWDLLFEKIRQQEGTIPKKLYGIRLAWKNNKSQLRTAIK